MVDEHETGWGWLAAFCKNVGSRRWQSSSSSSHFHSTRAGLQCLAKWKCQSETHFDHIKTVCCAHFQPFLPLLQIQTKSPDFIRKPGLWASVIIILLLYDDGAKAVLLRWKEWWVALFIEKNGGWHFAVTSVSLDPRIHDRFTADAVKFTIVIIPVFRCCCMYNHDQRLHSPFICADIRVKSESNPICPSQIWVIKGSSSARQFYSTN